MPLTQKQRNEIRYALEDQGIPEVLAFMAARNALSNSPTEYLSQLFCWAESPEGHTFWQQVAATAGQYFASGATVPFPDLHNGWSQGF